MSFFGVGGGSGANQVSNEESKARMVMAKAEMENMQDMFSRCVPTRGFAPPGRPPAAPSPRLAVYRGSLAPVYRR